MDRSKYPPDWEAISACIRARAGGRCECEGECGYDHDDDAFGALQTQDGRCVERNHQLGLYLTGRVVLTVAHLDHDPANCDPHNLRAYCQRCHNAYDADDRRRNRARNRRAAREEQGQMNLEVE